MPCPLHALLTPRGSVTFRTTIRPRNLHPLKAIQSPICTTQKPPMAGHKSQRRNPTSRLADARGMNVCGASPLQNGKRNNSRAFYRAEFLTPTPGTTTQGHLLCLSGIQATCSGQFLSSRRGCRIGASQRTKVEAHTNMHFFVRLLEVSRCPPRAPRIGSGVPITPVAEHVQGTTLGDLRSEPMKKPDLYVDPVLNFELLPLLGLGRVE